MLKEHGKIDTFGFEDALADVGGWRTKFQKFEAGDTIYPKGRRSRHVYLVTDGLVVLHRKNPHKDPKSTKTIKDVTTDIIRIGAMFGLDRLAGDKRHPEDAIAQRATTVTRVPYSRFKKIAGRPDVIPHIWSILAHAHNRNERQQVLYAYGNTNDKVAGALENFMEADNKVSVTQDELAQRAGAHRVSVNKSLRRLREKGIIQLQRKNFGQLITVLEPTKLFQRNGSA